MQSIKTSTSKGFSLIGLVLGIGALGAIWLVAVGVHHQYVVHHRPPNDSAQTSKQTLDITSFSDCIRAGGFTDSVRIGSPGNSNYVDPEGIYNGLSCRLKMGGDSQLAVITFCKLTSDCDHLDSSGLATCMAQYQARYGLTTAWNNTNVNELVYPVMKDGFGRIQVKGCTTSMSSQTIPAFVAYYKLSAAGQWEQLGVFFDSTPCRDIEGKGLPMELLYSCLDDKGYYRVPK